MDQRERGAPRRLRREPIAVAVAGILIACIVAFAFRHHTDRNTPLQGLIELSADHDRYFEPRLTGFRWSRLRRNRFRLDEAPRFRLAAAAGDAVRIALERSSPEARHAAAIGYLLTGRFQESTELLENLAKADRDARVSSDLAAAQYALAAANDDPWQLTRALASADRAILLDAHLPEAHFNRALILERLGLRDYAREAWEDYLRLDSAGGWADEGRDHVRELQPVDVFEDLLECQYEQLIRAPSSVHELATRYRQDARTWGETEILRRWAAAERNGNETASRHLAVAREIGAELARGRGEGMLRELVAAIDRAEGESRRALMEAHLAYADGRDTYGRQKQPARARLMFLNAEKAFRRGGSPGERLARFFAANTLHPLGRAEESRETLEQLLASCPPEFMAHRAQVLWQLGLVHYARSRWGEAITALDESAALFDRLDEGSYAASIREILANAHDRIGDRRTSWRHRILVLHEFGRRPSSRLLTTLTYLSRSAVKNGDWPTAVSLLALSANVSRRIDDKPIQIAMYLQRAHLHLRMAEPGAARMDLLAARAAARDIADPGYQSLFAANATAIEALLTADPAVTIDLLTRPIAFHGSGGVRAMLPELLLERGRAYLRMHDYDRASADFEAGIAELESNRESLPSSDDRIGIFRDGEDLFHEAITLALNQNDAARALQYVERARARALLDSLGTRWPSARPADVPEGTVIIEYFFDPEHLTVFVLDHRRIRVVRQDVDDHALLQLAMRFANAARTSNRQELLPAGRLLHRRLIAPIETFLSGAGTVVIVPDPRLADLPFAALVGEDNRFLVERHTIVVSPSAAVYMRLTDTPPAPRPTNLLVVTGNAQDLAPLTAARREADSVARLYDQNIRLDREQATVTAFARAAASVDAIHFAGHGVASTVRGGSGYLVMNPDRFDDGLLDLKEIAALNLDRISLVVLAACSTSAGETIATEGTITVGRAFLAAGARSVISTLWPVDDEAAAQFFPVVHHHISRGLAPAEALRAAQLEWIRKPESLTSLWTGVQIIGTEGRALRH